MADMMYTSKELSRSLGIAVIMLCYTSSLDMIWLLLGSSQVFVNALVKRLTTTKEAIVLLSLLRMLHLLFQNHANPKQWINDHNLYSVVREVAQAKGQVLVMSSAKILLRDFQSYTS